jgi:hypothetical protein
MWSWPISRDEIYWNSLGDTEQNLGNLSIVGVTVKDRNENLPTANYSLS